MRCGRHNGCQQHSGRPCAAWARGAVHERRAAVVATVAIVLARAAPTFCLGAAEQAFIDEKARQR